MVLGLSGIGLWVATVWILLSRTRLPSISCRITDTTSMLQWCICLELCHAKLAYRNNGIDHRFCDVHDQVIQEITGH